MTSGFACGLRVEADLPITGLPASGSAALGSVRVERDTAPLPDVPSTPDFEGELCGHRLSMHAGSGHDGAGLRVRLTGLADFRMRTGDRRLRYTPAPEPDLEALRLYLVDYVLPLHLSLEGRVRFLHAGAVDVGPGAVGFLASSGTGKSTLVAEFLERGYPLVADDQLGVTSRDQVFLAVPGTPFYRLGDGPDERVLHARRFATALRPLLALYVLAPVGVGAPTSLTLMSPLEAIRELNRAFVAHLPCRLEERVGRCGGMRARFRWWADMASRVRVFRLEVPRTISRLHEVYEQVMVGVDAAGVRSC